MSKRVGSICSAIFLLFVSAQSSLAQRPLLPCPVTLVSGKTLHLKAPAGYRITPAAQDARRLRFLAKSPDGCLFGTDLWDKSDNTKGRILLFTDWDAARKIFRRTIVFAAGLHNPNSITFGSEGGKHFLYIAETHRLTRYQYVPGDTALRGSPIVLATFPDYGLSYKYGGWHLTRTVCFGPDGKLYVSVGSSCNACIEKEPVRATVMVMDPDGKNKRVYAYGLRNSVGLRWVDGRLWATAMGRDLIGPDKPEDGLLAVERNSFNGWPYFFQYAGKVYPDPALHDSAKKAGLSLPPQPGLMYCGFSAHSAPLGFDYMKGFADPLLANTFLVALHGSTSVWRQRGNALVYVKSNGRYEELIAGFLEGKDDSDRKGRPCDVLMNDPGSFFFTDDENGVLFYVEAGSD